ncbi:hypothetical protein PPO43_08670 [Saprospira sp. CCB-QB6]|uniref:hypothetical protein n=1 Tax=Saprospira sp. CCB-QB6 TaxID=3023936 RepID=UPI002349299B|nr:hypothetical protein [Saprospira sp. CCB-QB6]WCL80052.1 hypothetical protein PPO43_08670 [Saprospira sp. CCB-QB6]
MITEERKLELLEKMALKHAMSSQERELAHQLTKTEFREEYEDYKMLFQGLDGLAAESLIADMKKWDEEAPKVVLNTSAKTVRFLSNFRLWHAAASIFLVFGLGYGMHQLFPSEDRYFSALEAVPLYTVTRGDAVDVNQTFVVNEYAKGNYKLIMQEMGGFALEDLQTKDAKLQLIFSFSSLKTGQELEKAEALLLSFPEDEEKPRLHQLKDFQLFLLSYRLGKEEVMDRLGKKILSNQRHEHYHQVKEFYEKKGLGLPQ